MAGMVSQPALADLPRPFRKASAEVAATATVAGIVELATQAEVDTGTDAVRAVTPATLASATTTGFPSGTRMLFQQTAAPTGWTKETVHNNKALRLQTGTVTTGGTDDFTTTFSSSKATDSFTLTTSETPAHPHAQRGSTSGINGTVGIHRNDTANDGAGGNTASDGGSGGGHAHTMAIDLEFVDFIIAIKD